ncbi:GntR family transcriptional regulator [Catenulispora pinisilvae]|uniref:GntR family transcriptional regulator n=1 Tax=Catenulispora pinisilvae TaxID=2705253 RepID=UPI001891C1DA|nr:GntR family transcriptional regulator [Catenulispora pinisilvae]
MSTVLGYRQLAGRLRKAVLDGVHPLGAKLPSEHEIAEEYGVSRSTVRRAFALLTEEGVIASHQGARRTVLARPREQNFAELRSFSRWARLIGEVPSGRTVSLERATADEREAEKLGLAIGDPLFRLTRVRLLSGRPVMIERTAYVERVGTLLATVDLGRESICDALELFGIFFEHAEHAIDAINADPADAALLETAVGTALLREHRRTTDPSGSPLEWSDDRYLGDAMAFIVRNSVASAPLARSIGDR